MTENEISDWEWASAETDGETTEQEPEEIDDATTEQEPEETDDETTRQEPVKTGPDGANHAERAADPTDPDAAKTTRVDTILDGVDVDGTELTATQAKRLLSILDGADIDQTNVDSLEAEGGMVDALTTGQSEGSLTDASGVVRIVAEVAWQISDYSIRAQLRATRRMARAVATSQSSEELLTETLAIAEDELRRAEDELSRQGVDQRSRNRTADRRDDAQEQLEDTSHAGDDRTPTEDGTLDRETVEVGEETTEQRSVETDPADVEAEEPRSDLDKTVENLPRLGSSGVQRFLSDAPRIARLTVGATRRVAEYSARAQYRTARRMARAASTAESSEELLDETRDLAIEESQRLGLDIGQELTHRVAGRRGVTSADADEAEQLLSERGERVLRQSADVDYEEPVHPAYAHILEELSVDEARILRLLATEGMQPAVDVRSSSLLSLSSELIAEELSMVGIEAGCHRPDRASAYLGNLQRLGLVRISDEPLDDLKRYQVLEAQPDVAQAEEKARRPNIVYRSIRLTPFGTRFCRLCLSVDVDAEQAVGTTESHDDDAE